MNQFQPHLQLLNNMSVKIIVPEQQFWDEKNEVFIYTKGGVLQLEHSLLSISKWEKKWHKAFLGDKKKSPEETLDYIRCMTINQNVSPEIYDFLTSKNMKDISDYINDSMTATWFSDDKKNKKIGGRIVTAELIYNWMIDLNIPMDFKKEHINSLITLMRVREAEHRPKKRSNKKDTLRKHASINKARRKNK